MLFGLKRQQRVKRVLVAGNPKEKNTDPFSEVLASPTCSGEEGFNQRMRGEARMKLFGNVESKGLYLARRQISKYILHKSIFVNANE